MGVENEDEMSNITLVKQFIDVFTDEVVGKPPKREVKFSIDMVLGIGPILMKTYKMVLVELNELKRTSQRVIRETSEDNVEDFEEEITV